MSTAKASQKAPPASAARIRWAVELADGIQDLAWSPDGRWLAAAAVSGPLSLLDTASGAVHQSWAGHAGGTLKLAWSPDSAQLASSGQDGYARLWNPDSAADSIPLAAGSAWVGGVSFSPYADLLITAAGKELRAWKRSGEQLHAIKPHASTITELAWHPRQPLLASSAFGQVHLWDWATPEAPQEQTLPHSSSLLNVCWSPNGLYLACGCQDSSLRCWTWPDLKSFQMSGYASKLTTLAWDHASRWLATADREMVTLWEFADGPPMGGSPLNIEGPSDTIRNIGFQATGLRLAAGTRNGELLVWDVDPEGYRLRWQGTLRGGFQQLAWHPQERLLAVGGENGTVAVFEFIR